MTTNEIQKLDYMRGEVRYTIHVEQIEGGGMWGTWNCSECGVGGSSAKQCATIDDAVAAAKSDLDRHHITTHQV
jgi:hypothetical protein